MRLIDADLFKERIMSGYYVYCQENKQDIIDAIDCEPTVNPSLKLDNITKEDIEKFKRIWRRANGKGIFMTEEEYEQNVGRLYTDEGYLGGDDQ